MSITGYGEKNEIGQNSDAKVDPIKGYLGIIISIGLFPALVGALILLNKSIWGAIF